MSENMNDIRKVESKLGTFYAPFMFLKNHIKMLSWMNDEIIKEIKDDPKFKFVEFKYDNSLLFVYMHTNRCTAVISKSAFNDDLSNYKKVLADAIERWKTLPEIEEKEQYEGLFKEIGKVIKFSRVWGGHRFTDKECKALLDGETIQFNYTSSSGEKRTTIGRLKVSEYEGIKYYGFVQEGWPLEKIVFGKKLNRQQYNALKSGETIRLDGCISKKGNKFNAFVWYTQEKGIDLEYIND